MQKNRCKILLNIAVLFGVAMFLFNCQQKQNKSTINLEADLTKIPTRELFNANIIRTDSGVAMMRIEAPVIQEFNFDINKAYTLLPQGGKVERYNRKGSKPVLMESNWAKKEEKNGLYEGKDHVVMISENGDTVKTSHIFWNKNKKKIYNNVKTKIIRPNNDYINAKNGFESDEDFKNIKMYNTRTITTNANLSKID